MQFAQPKLCVSSGVAKLTLSWVDLCRGRACKSNPHPIRYQAWPGRHCCSHRHIVRVASGNLWLHESSREDRIHPRASRALHRKQRLDTSWYSGTKDKYALLRTKTAEIRRPKGEGTERKGGERAHALRWDCRRGRARRRRCD